MVWKTHYFALGLVNAYTQVGTDRIAHKWTIMLGGKYSLVTRMWDCLHAANRIRETAPIGCDGDEDPRPQCSLEMGELSG